MITKAITNNMKKLLVILSMVVLAGCYNDNEQDLYPVPTNPTTPPTPGTDSTVSFSAKIKPILDSKCATAGCHDANGLGGGYNFTTYAGVKQAVTNNRLLGAIKHEQGFSQMPKGMPPLDAATIDLFTKWVNQGALNN
ncbi:MAG: hypothetical protein K0R82_2167 [Flavipsychrobacter sp.]|nr:hypothetical protein [Flavipsychrobacter sp.]